MTCGTGPIATENQFPCRTLVACLLVTTSSRFVAPHSSCSPQVAAIGSQLKHCLQGCKNIMFCLFSMDPLDLRDLGLAMTRECIPPGQLYPEVFGGVEVNPVATVRADSEKSPESPLEPQGYMAVVVPVSPHTVQVDPSIAHCVWGCLLWASTATSGRPVWVSCSPHKR